MVFLYSEFAGAKEIILKDISHLKARRLKTNDLLNLRNLKDNLDYRYKIKEIFKKEIVLNLIDFKEFKQEKSNLIVAISMIDTAVLEKILPSINELNVDKLVIVYSKYSQKNFKISMDRIKRILINSSEQCGRGTILEIEEFKNLKSFLDSYKNVARIDFEGESLNNYLKNEILLIGPEGGFSSEERELIKKSYRLNSNLILKSNTAIIATLGKILF